MLIINAGSTSLKLRFLDTDDTLLADRELPAVNGGFDEDAVAAQLDALDGVDAVGHRVVHGGPKLSTAVLVDERVEAYLRSLVDLAPLHQPPALEGIDLARRLLPGVPAVACFDTAFHAGLPAAASTYAVPQAWRKRYSVRRYGFHGLSHAYASRRAAQLLGVEAERTRMVTCHLGAGASLAAVAGGKSVDTTMGFTPLEGLVMATRPGNVDPGLLLWLQRPGGLTEPELSDALEHRSGLVALAGTADMRAVLARAAGGDDDARLALDVYVHRLRAGVAAMTAAMDGIDALVFTGGVGENSHDVRAAAAAGLGFLGVALDPKLNTSATGDADIGAGSAAVRTLVVRAREDLEIARQAREVLASGPGAADGEQPTLR
ncbi:MAG TPA: acetate/propionate family kinase [Candidatus Dormibacteraeota bacterium]|nr:acetate/propionate family kinase [Candidatus Dormibacteraeota bacterium]